MVLICLTLIGLGLPVLWGGLACESLVENLMDEPSNGVFKLDFVGSFVIIKEELEGLLMIGLVELSEAFQG